jgi:TolB protein
MADWQLIKARFLICGAVEAASGGYKVTVRVYDINCKQKLLVFSVIVNKANLRKAAHMASDQIYTRLTGEKGMFNTQITYIEPVASERRGRSGVSYRRTLKKMDQDGANCVALTDGRDLVLTPRYSPDGKTIAFLRYRTERVGGRNKRMAHVALVDVATKKVTPLLTPAHFKAISQANGGAEVNMTYAPRFSPDGKFLCFSLIIDGKSAIYTISRDGSNVRRLTTPVSIDTSPAYSADGRKIVFTSDRSGKEKIYIMNTDGTNVMRITSNEGKYSQPVFSPRGDLIAFSKQIGNQFFIGVVQPNGQGERLIVQAGMAEAPQWSPNGRYIIFTRQTTMSAPRRICIIDLTGLFMREIQTPGEAYDAYWSPLLQ